MTPEGPNPSKDKLRPPVNSVSEGEPPQSDPIPFTEWLEKLRKEVERARDGKFLNRKIVKERA